MSPAFCRRTSRRGHLYPLRALVAANSALSLGWLGLVLLSLVLATGQAAHAGSKSFILDSSAEREDHFPKIRAYATESHEEVKDSLRIRIHYPSGERQAADEAFTHLQRLGQFLSQETGLPLEGRLDIYLFPLPPGREAVPYKARGAADFTDVLFLRTGVGLLQLRHNRRHLLTFLPHELSHLLLRKLDLKDRWLEDGLAEYLRHRFAHQAVTQGWIPPESNASVFIHSDNWIPSLVALGKTPLEPWSYETTSRLLRRQKRDPVYALYLARQEWWKYAAARGLISRWIEALAASGSEHPVRDLIESIRGFPGKVDWEATAELIRRQTGRSREELARVTQKELSDARHRAWSQRADPLYSVRLEALRTLAFLGLPPSAASEDLLPSFELPAGVANPEGLLWNLQTAAAGAVAAAHEPTTVHLVARALEEQHDEEAYFFAPPEFWRILVEKNRKKALDALVRLVQDPRIGLDSQQRANSILEEVTGKEVGWSPDHKPKQREELSARWEEVVRKHTASDG